MGQLGYFGKVVRKDVEYLKGSLSKGIEWANVALRIPQVSRTISDVVWFRNLEDSGAAGLKAPTFPQPQYPGNFNKIGIWLFRSFLFDELLLSVVA